MRNFLLRFEIGELVLVDAPVDSCATKSVVRRPAQTGAIQIQIGFRH